MMKKALSYFFLLSLFLSSNVFALLSLELTQGVAGAIPIAIVPFATDNTVIQQDLSSVITNDLQNSGRFKVFGRKALNVFPSDAQQISVQYFRRLGTDNVVIGKIKQLATGQYQIEFQLLDIYSGKVTATIQQQYQINPKELRALGHHISDVIYKKLTGVKGIFSTKLAYVVVSRSNNGVTQYTLEVADQDGYNPRPLLQSSEPIMSPAWSPNGKELAYVSFENQRASIYIQDIAVGSRYLLSDFPGINGAPAWSPDGKKLAVVLSKNQSPNIYIMDIATQQLKQVTRDFYINTEPAWSQDGKFLLYTSNRGGNPQIYQVNLASGDISRVSYDGSYNARASFAKDGRHVAMIHRVSGIYNIALLDLDAGTTKVLNTHAADSASPSVAPNGSMILYDTYYRGRNVLAMVSADGRVQLVLPARHGEAQDPAWSPFLS